MKHQYLPCFLLLLLLLIGQAALAQAPTITVLSPTRNGRNAPATTYVSITFDQPISCGTITLGAVRVFSQQRGSTSASGNTLTFDPATNFRPGETILTTVTSSAQRSGGGGWPGGRCISLRWACAVQAGATSPHPPPTPIPP